MGRNLKYIVLPIIYCILLISCKNQRKFNVSESANPYHACIKNAFSFDDSIGRVRNHNCKRLSLSETIKIYTESLEKIDFNNCPKEFESAFIQHKIAWQNMVEVTDQYPDLRGEMHDLFEIIEKQKSDSLFKSKLDFIWSTWRQVEKSSNNHIKSNH